MKRDSRPDQDLAKRSAQSRFVLAAAGRQPRIRLLPRSQWQALKAADQTSLARDGDVRAYLNTQEQAIHEELQALQRDLYQIPGLSVEAHGQLHLHRLEPAVPDAAVQLSRRLYARVPSIDLPDLLLEVMRGTLIPCYTSHYCDTAITHYRGSALLRFCDKGYVWHM